jgi:UDP-N-acetylmuramate-alanine ligase
MGGVALLARAAGHKVTGCDANVYPPMSTQLEEQGIGLVEGYGVEQLGLKPDVFVVGNAISRGNPLLEAILDQGLPYVSGPQWLAENVLQGRWVLAVAGTHGKTTTTSLLAWILEDAGLKPGFLVGGVPKNFGVSARLGETPFFVIEADEYDTAFCDKRSKFVHYRPRTAILNNLEFDHADIFADLRRSRRNSTIWCASCRNRADRRQRRGGIAAAGDRPRLLVGAGVVQRCGRLVGGRGARTKWCCASRAARSAAVACPCRAATTGPTRWRPSPRRATWG